MFPESLVYLQERVDLKKYLPDNMDSADLSVMDGTCFLHYNTVNGPRLFVFDQDLAMINQKDPFSGNFNRFKMKEHGGGYLFGNLIFDKDLKGPYVFDRFSLDGTVKTSNNFEVPSPPDGTMLVIESENAGSVRYINIWSDYSIAFHSVYFSSDWNYSSGGDFDFADYINHEFKLYYNPQDKKAYMAFFIKDSSNSRVELFRYDDSMYTLQDFHLSDFFTLKVAEFEDMESSEFLFTQKGIVVLKGYNREISLYDYSGKKIGYSNLYDDHGDMNYSVTDDGKTIYVFDREYRILSKQSIWWKNE